jgi:transposase
MNKSASGFGLSAPGHQREVGATRADRAAGAQGLQNKDITEPLGIGRVQVARWRQRYLDWGLQGIERDLPRGAPPVKGMWPGWWS